MTQAPLALNRKKDRGHPDRAKLDALLDEVLVGTLSTVQDGRPLVVPLLFARDGDRILLHGSTGAGALRVAAAGAPVVFSVHVVDGLVVAESTFNSSANYRSAVVAGVVEVIEGDAAWSALDTLSDRLLPGRTAELSPMTTKQVAQTIALALPLLDGQWLYKERTGGTGEPEDPSEGVWRGVVPLRVVADAPEPSPGSEDLPVPASVERLRAAHPVTP